MIEPLLQAERLLLHGMVDQAEELYRRTFEADPRNAMAVVGLAHVALERGDDGLAYRHAVAALEIDRDNAAALRLEARLSEVLAARGERVERPAWLTAGQPAPLAPPAPSAPSAAEPAAGQQREEPRPSEQAVLVRNPSMADHRRVEAQRQHQPSAPPATEPQAPRRRSLLRRLLGR